MLRRLFSPIALLTGFAAATPATAETVHDEQSWVNLTLMGTVTDRMVYFAEVQPRIGDGISRLDQLLIRPAIGWKLTPEMTLYQGYAHVITPVDGGTDLKEDRSFQQLSWVMAHPWSGEFSTRTRLEQRWRNNGNDMGWRFREMLRLEVPLKPGGKVAALGYSETFIALNNTDWGARGGFDQQRSFIGSEITVHGKSTVELGYLNQYINQTGGRSRMNHVLSIALFVRH